MVIFENSGINNRIVIYMFNYNILNLYFIRLILFLLIHHINSHLKHLNYCHKTLDLV